LFGQSFKAYSNAAEEAFIGKDYYSALVFFNQALEFKKKRTDIMYKAAESARQINAYAQAEEYFQIISETDELNKYPLATLYLAEAQQKLGKYDLAKNNFALFIADSPDDSENIEIAQLGISACEWALEIDSSTTTSVKAMGANVNTPYSEFGASIFEKEVTFSSMRYKREQEELKLPDQLFSKILNSKEEEEATIIKTFDTEYDMTANSTFNKDRTAIYYTKCRYINNIDIRCQIYMRSIAEDGTYGSEVAMPDYINLEGSTSTHPNVAFDTYEDAEYLYFSSDRSGGKGKLDIWRSKIDADGNFERPTNVEAVNTSADEITPAFHSLSQTLYFSTDGRIGMGGFDIFKTVKVKDSWAEIENIGPPVNSSLNDIYFILGDDFSTGLLSSNRIGSMYLDPNNEACCYDVYQAEFINLELIATAYDNSTKEQLTADFKLIHDQSGYEEEEMNIEELRKSITPENTYTLIASKKGYVTETITFSTENIKQSEEIIKKLYLKKAEMSINLLAFDKKTENALNGTIAKVYEIGGKLVVEKTNPSGNDYSFTLKKGKAYRIEVSKEGYTPETLLLETDDLDPNINLKAYLGRIPRPLADLEGLLPIKLYFDNDEPDSKTIATSTAQSFVQSFDKYYNRKDEFKRLTARGLGGDDKAIAENKIETFFNSEVKHGKERLLYFINLMIAHMDRGEKIDIIVRGYASPLAKADYNQALSQRRVSSIRNEISRYRGGIMKKYLDSGQMNIKLVGFGERSSASGVSDSARDVKKSIYSVEASRERRVEIDSVELKN